MVKCKPRKSRQKIGFKRIEDIKAQSVCFFKRRSTVFNKAYELSVLCGAMIAAVFFSHGGNAFSFGHPSVDAVANRFLANGAPTNPIASNASEGEVGAPASISELDGMQRKLKKQLQASMGRNKQLKEAIVTESEWQEMVFLQSGNDELCLDDLEKFEKMLTSLMATLSGSTKVMLEDANQVHVAPKP